MNILDIGIQEGERSGRRKVYGDVLEEKSRIYSY